MHHKEIPLYSPVLLTVSYCMKDSTKAKEDVRWMSEDRQDFLDARQCQDKYVRCLDGCGIYPEEPGFQEAEGCLLHKGQRLIRAGDPGLPAEEKDTEGCEV